MGILLFVLIVPLLYLIGKSTYNEMQELFIEEEKLTTECVIIPFPENIEKYYETRNKKELSKW